MHGATEQPGVCCGHESIDDYSGVYPIPLFCCILPSGTHPAFVVQCTACPLSRVPFLNGTQCIATCPSLVQQGVCTSMCSPGFFADEQQCVECDETCRTCTGGGHLQCTSCNPGRFLLNGECRTCRGCTQCGKVSASAESASDPAKTLLFCCCCVRSLGGGWRAWVATVFCLTR